MLKHDNQIITSAQGLVSNFELTRYADDITFSCNENGKCNHFVDLMKINLKKITNPELYLNYKKTRFSSTGTKRYILGLAITPNGKISIGRKRKRIIHHLLNKLKYNKLIKEKYNYLKGMLAYILDVEPDFYNRLVIIYCIIKYKEEVFNNLYKSE